MDIYVNEIFYSLQGETSLSGFPSLFIRLAGCNLDCKYCDTAHAKSRENSKLMSIKEIVKIARQHSSTHHITITGGEPLIQTETFKLIQALGNAFFLVQVETNGSISIAKADRRARYIVDVKTPSSGHDDSFNFENIKTLSRHDEVKFVITLSKVSAALRNISER
jgi:7-carboxy-7-deazaguanine synthase